jgi:hypothetical protein
MSRLDPIQRVLQADAAKVKAEQSLGPIATLLPTYTSSSSRLLGYILDMSYDEATIVTCDAWKRKCGGVPKNSFVIIRLNSSIAALTPEETLRPALILGRVIQPVATPLSADIQQTIFSIHKVQAVVDPYTDAELQWGALKVAILGTYYDDESRDIIFGNDIDSYVSPHFYEVYVPTAEHLTLLINSFVHASNPMEIGILRYTETQTAPRQNVPVFVTLADFIGNRTALFGKTRMGKSNTVKIIADMILRSGAHVGQLIFDLNGEYANINEWDQTSLYALHQERCIRYTLNPRPKIVEGVPAPQALKVNFFQQVELGHSVITSLYREIHRQQPPNYLQAFLEWSPCDEARLVEQFPNFGDRTRYIRARSLYFAVLVKANFACDSQQKIQLSLSKPIRIQLGQIPEIRRIAAKAESWTNGRPEIADVQQIKVAIQIYTGLYRLWQEEQNRHERSTRKTTRRTSPRRELPGSQLLEDDISLPSGLWGEEDGEELNQEQNNEEVEEEENEKDAEELLFPTSKRTGDPYFDPIHICFLRMLGDRSISGVQYLIPFGRYHALTGSNIEADIVQYINSGKTVLIDLANADEVLTRYYSERISYAIFSEQTKKFTEGILVVSPSSY